MLALGCGGAKETAATVRLTRVEGNLDLTDAEHTPLTPAERMALYSGYTLATWENSCAWMALDSERLARLDDESTVELRQEGRALRLDLQEGGLYFNIEKPLAEDETLEICSSDMMVGIRGTCGWVVKGEQSLWLYLLEGTVECKVETGDPADPVTETVTAGQHAILWRDTREIEVFPLEEEEIPPFVREELDEGRLEGMIAGWQGGGRAVRPRRRTGRP